MKLRLPHKFQAALMAALASVSITTLSSATAFAQDTPLTFDGDAGKVLFMGDSITNGYFDMTHRWQLFKTFVDNGVVFDIDGPLSGYDSSHAPSANYNPDYGTAYRGKAFENVHYAKSSGRSGEMINGTSRYEGVSIAQVGQTNYDTYSLLIGTNDLLSDKGYTYDNFKTKMQNLLGGTVSYSGTGTDATWSWTPGETPGGNLNTIVESLNLNQGDEFLMLSIPVWTTNGNNNEATIHAAVAGYNKLLQQWVANYNSREDAATTIKYVDVNEGILDLTSTTPFFGNKSFFNNGNDGLHPSNQGSLIMAGNEARAMGIGGRTAGLHRSSAQVGKDWTTVTGSITLTEAGSSQDVAGVAFTEENGYTVDFTATFGNGGEGGWLDADKDRPASGVAKVTTFSTLTNSLNITVGDGTHTGTLKLAEGYVAWDCGSAGGDMVLYCQNNSVSGNEALRIAYRAADSANNILGGYYVWKGDMLIGQGLAASGGAGFDGIRVSLTGGDSTGGTVSGISWANTAYAPTTNLFSQEPLPSHDNPNKQGNKEGVAWAPAENLYANTAGSWDHTTTSNAYTGAAQNTTVTGDIDVRYSGDSNTGAVNGVLAVFQNGATVNGNVYLQFDAPNATYGHWTGGGGMAEASASLVGTYNGAINGSFTAVINAGSFDSSIYGGAYNDTRSITGGTNVYINGGSIAGNVFGGGKSGTITGGAHVTVTGGAIAGSVYGGGSDGSITGGSSVTVTGGTIAGGVYGGGSGGTIEGGTSVVVDGILPYIGGDIVADTVTLQNVDDESEHSDTFDKYRGRIRAASTLVLNKYTVERLLASVETQSLVLQGNSKTTVGNLTLTACEITVEDGSELTLEGVNTYGNTTTYSGHVAIANGTTFTLHTATMTGEASGYSDGENGFAMGTMIVLNPLAEGNSLYGTDGNPLTSTTTDTLIGGGILSGATFSYNATTGQLTAEAKGTGGPYFVNEGTVVYNSSSTAYQADDIRLNGGTLQFQETLKDGTALSVIKEGSGIIVDNGVSLNASIITYGTDVNGFALSGEGELILTAANAEQILTTVTGTGTMRLTENAGLTGNKSSVSTGTYIVGNGSGSQITMTVGNSNSDTSSIASFNKVVLDNGKLSFHAATDKVATVKNLDVTSAGGYIYVDDVGHRDNNLIRLSGQTTLQGDLTLESQWKNKIVVDKLLGDGDLVVKGSAYNGDNTMALVLTDASAWTGTLNYAPKNTNNVAKFAMGTDGAGSTASTGATLQLANNANLRMFMGTQTEHSFTSFGGARYISFASTVLGSGVTIQTHTLNYTGADGTDADGTANGVGFGDVTMAGNATITADHNGSYIKMDSLAGTGTLTINAAAGSSARTTLDLGGADTTADFNGTIVLWLNNNSANKRGAFAVINDEYAAANAELQIKNEHNNTNKSMGLGINADLVKLGGLSEGGYTTTLAAYTLFSGDASGSVQCYTYGAYGSRGGMRTLEFTGAGTYSTSIKVLNNISLAMSGTGSQSFTGDMSQFNGSISVTNGTLALTPNSAIATHAVNVESAGTLTIAPTGSNAITAFGTMVNEGNLTLSGTVALNSSDLSAYTMVEGSGSQTTYSGKDTYAGSGFLVSSAEYYLVKGNGTLTGSVTIDENTGTKVSQDDNSIIVTFKPNETGGLYYVNDNFTYNAEEMGNASGFVIAKGATLTAADNGTLATPAKVLHGAGKYALASQATGLNGGLTLGADWTGSVVLSGPKGTTVQQINLQNSAVGAAGAVSTSLSTIELKGIQGWLKNSGTSLNNANLIMTNPDASTSALKLDNGTTGATTYFTGSISGSGDFEHAWNKSTVYFEMQGDVSQWTGNIIKSAGGATVFTLNNNPGGTIAVGAKGNSGTLSINVTNNTPVTLTGNFVKGSGTLNVNVQNTTQATFTGDITNANLSVNTGASATLGKGASIGTLSGAGTLAYNGESAGTVNITGNLTNFTGSLVNKSDEDMTVSLSANATTVKSNISSTGEGKVNLSLATNQDYNMYGTQSVNNIAHSANVTLKVRDNGNVTATGKVLTGRLVVGEGSTETGAVFTLSDTGACLVTSGTDHRYTASVQGYGTFRVADGATQTLAPDANHNLTGFYGTFAAEGQDSVLTLNGALANDAKLLATDGGKVELGTAVNSLGTLSVESTGILKLSEKDSAAVSANTITLANGAVLDLSALSLTGAETTPVVLLKGGAVDATNLAGVQVTYGEQDVSKHSVLSVNDSNALVLTFASFDLVWDNNTTTQYWTADSNWHTPTDDRHHVRFYNGDNVHFVSTTAAPSPILGSNVSVGTMTVDSGVNLTLDTHGHDLTAENLVANGATLTKNGAGTATFNGAAVSLVQLAVNGGTAVFNQQVTVTGSERVNVYGSNATFAQGINYTGTKNYGLVVSNGNTDATVTLGGDSDMGGKLLGVAAHGTLTIEEGVTVTAAGVYNSGTLASNGTIIVKQNAKLIAASDYVRATDLQNAGTITAVNADIQTLTNTGLINLVGTGAGSLARLNVTSRAEQMDLGAFHLDNGEIHIGSDQGDNRVRNFTTITVDGAGKLTQQSWNNLMHIAALNDGTAEGERSFTWQMGTTHNINSVLYLDGAGTFSGTFTADRTANATTNGAYQGHLQINNGQALQHAVLNVTGANASNYMSVALNTDAVEICGLTGNANAIVYAGQANTAASGGKSAPTSTGTSTLTLNVAGGAAHTYSGKVLGGISLVKAGAGTQTFSGDMGAFNGTLTLNAGTLAFTSATTATGLTGVAGTTLSTTANLTVDTAQTSTFAGTLAGTGSFTKAGSGTLTLTAANTISGGVAVNGGTLETTNSTALGTGNVSIGANGTLQVSENLTIKGDTTAGNKGINNLGTVSIADGKTLTLWGLVTNKQYNLGTIAMQGQTATIENTNHRGTLSLAGVTGAADSTLYLFSNHSSNPATWNLGTADSGSFAGSKLVLKVGDSSGTTTGRTVSYNFNNGSMFSGSTVQLENATAHQDATMTNNVVLNAAEVHMGGIKDAADGTVTEKRVWSVSKSASAGDRAKLVLDGNDANGYSTAVKVGAGIDIQKTGSATQVFSGDMSQFNGSVDVEAGVLNIMNAASVSVQDVTIGANGTLGVYKGTEPTVGSTTEGTLTIANTKTLTAAGKGATLNSNLELATGSTLDVSATGGTGLHLGSTLTINPGMQLSDNDMRGVWDLEIGQTYNLVYGEQFEKLFIKDSTGSVTATYNPGELTAANKLDAHTFYNDLQENHYYVVFTNDGGNVGTYAIYCNVPEPTTSTLSLLALAALAARRRKHN